MAAPDEGPAFDRVGEQFIDDYYESVRGYVREQLVQRNLAKHLGTRAMQIADVGGGDARVAIWLAHLNPKNQITVIEPSTFMLGRAEERLADQKAGIRSRVSLIQGDHKILPDTDVPYDMVLSHAVMMYDPGKPEEHVRFLFDALKKGGTLSLLTKGYSGAMHRLASKADFTGMSTLAKTKRTINNRDEEVWALHQHDVISMIHANGGTDTEWYGVRIISDELDQPFREFPVDQLNLLVNEEERLGTQMSTRGMGQMLHFLSLKNGI